MQLCNMSQNAKATQKPPQPVPQYVVAPRGTTFFEALNFERYVVRAHLAFEFTLLMAVTPGCIPPPFRHRHGMAQSATSCMCSCAVSHPEDADAGVHGHSRVHGLHGIHALPARGNDEAAEELQALLAMPPAGTEMAAHISTDEDPLGSIARAQAELDIVSCSGRHLLEILACNEEPAVMAEKVTCLL